MASGCGIASLGAQSSDRDPELKIELKAYSSLLKRKDNRRGRHDGEALKVMDKIMARFAKLSEKDRRLVAKNLADTFRIARRKPKNAKLYFAAVTNLAKTGRHGAAPLRKLFTAPRIAKGTSRERKSWYELRAKILVALGKCQDGKTVDFLLDTALRNPKSDLFLAAAGRALGDYEKSPEAVRKDIACKLIGELNRIYGIANARVATRDPLDIVTPTFQRRYATIRAPWTRSLQRLTRQKLREPHEWQRFWNKFKSKPWRPGLVTSAGAKTKRRR